MPEIENVETMENIEVMDAPSSGHGIAYLLVGVVIGAAGRFITDKVRQALGKRTCGDENESCDEASETVGSIKNMTIVDKAK